MNVRFTPRAHRRARAVAAWWRANRPATADLFEEELEQVTAKLAALPATLGFVYATVQGIVIRRVMLPRTAQHVYFSVDATTDSVIVHTIWGARRGRGPRL